MSTKAVCVNGPCIWIRSSRQRRFRVSSIHRESVARPKEDWRDSCSESTQSPRALWTDALPSPNLARPLAAGLPFYRIVKLRPTGSAGPSANGFIRAALNRSTMHGAASVSMKGFSWPSGVPSSSPASTAVPSAPNITMTWPVPTGTPGVLHGWTSIEPSAAAALARSNPRDSYASSPGPFGLSRRVRVGPQETRPTSNSDPWKRMAPFYPPQAYRSRGARSLLSIYMALFMSTDGITCSISFASWSFHPSFGSIEMKTTPEMSEGSSNE